MNQTQMAVMKHALVQEREAHKQYSRNHGEIIEQMNKRQITMEE